MAIARLANNPKRFIKSIRLIFFIANLILDFCNDPYFILGKVKDAINSG